MLLSHFAYGKLIFWLLRRGSIMLRRAPLEGELRIALPPTGRGFLPGVCGGVSWNPAGEVASRAHLISLYHVCGSKFSMT